jgi:hypothetical protein
MFVKTNHCLERNESLLAEAQKDVRKITTEVKTTLKAFSENFE